MWLTIFVAALSILFIGYAVVLLLYRKWFLQLTPFAIPNTIVPQTTFSIIIPARNEALYIGNCLQSIVEQNYPDDLVEIIVIDDHSTDDTSLIVEQFRAKHYNIKLIKLVDELNGEILNSYKKKAIENAIGYATTSLDNYYRCRLYCKNQLVKKLRCLDTATTTCICCSPCCVYQQW
jgi:cellulose synthase/poly-beta-1,6-N-acetylglucosamine synthase-like glycosyltransferase